MADFPHIDSNPAWLKTLFASSSVRLLPKHHQLFRPGSVIDTLSYIESGFVRMYISSDTGQELSLHFFGPGSCFPLLPLIHEGKNVYEFETVTQVRLRSRPTSEVLPALQAHGSEVMALALRLISGMEGLLMRIQQTAFLPARERIWNFLLFLTKHFGERTDEGMLIAHTFSHLEISRWMGLSRENVSVHMKALERAGKVRRHHRQYLIPWTQWEA